VVVVSAVAAAFADGAPTGLGLADVFWRVALAAAVTYCAAFAPRWSWIVVAAVAAVAAVGGEGIVVGLALTSLALAVFAAVRRDVAPIVGVVAVGLAVQVLLRLPAGGFSGATALIAAVAVAPLFVTAWLGASRGVRRRAIWGLVLFGAFVALALVPAAITAVETSHETGVATRESRAWLDAARSGDQAAAVEHLDASAQSFGKVEDSTGAWWLLPARVLPVVGPQLDAVHEVASSGSRITESASIAARIATPENLRLQEGQIDLGLLTALREPLRTTSFALSDTRNELAELNTTWLLPPLRSKIDEYEHEVVDASNDTDLAVQALDVAPDLLGGDGPRTYLVLFASPAETRELGGFVGNAAIVTADNGHVELERVLRSKDLNDATSDLSPERIAALQTKGFTDRYLQYAPWRNWQNITGTPDFPAVSDMVRELAPEAIGRPVDGVLYIDPEGLAGLLQLTGPIQVEGLDQLIGPDNVTDFLLREQYVLYPQTPDRVDFLETVARTTFELLTTADLPGPRTMGDALGPAVDGGHLRMWTFDPDEQALFDRLGLTGSLPRSGTDDEVLVTVANANPNKIDAYLHRSVAYDANLDSDTGRVTARVTVELENDAPPDLSDYVIGNGNGEPPGTNRTFLSLYTGLGVDATSVAGTGVAFESHEEYGLRRAAVFVSVPAGGRTEVVFDLSGTVQQGKDAEDYTVGIRSPALVFPDHVTARLQATGSTVGRPELSGGVAAEPEPELTAGLARFDLRGSAVVRFPLGRGP
jgi:hypothetical protein